MKTKYQLRYLIIPHYAYQDNKLNWTSARVYGFINSYTNPFFFSNEHLGEMFNVHPQTISTAVKLLEKLGYINTTYKVKSDGGKTRLCVNAHSDSVLTLSPNEEKRARTKSKRSGKGFKGNNIRSKKTFLHKGINEETFKDKKWLEDKKARSERKKSGNNFQSRSKESPFPYKKENSSFREKTVAHGEHII